MKRLMLAALLLTALTGCAPNLVSYSVEVTYANGDKEVFDYIIDTGLSDDNGSPYLRTAEGQTCLVADNRGTIACNVRSFKTLSKTKLAKQ